MAQVVCFDAVAQRRHQDAFAAIEAREKLLKEATERIRKELIDSFMAGCAGYPVKLPYVRHQTGRKETQHFMHAVMETLDFDEVGFQLLAVLRESKCVHVIALKRLLAERYARANARDLAEVEVSE